MRVSRIAQTVKSFAFVQAADFLFEQAWPVSQRRMTSTATLNDQALPSIAAERCAKTRNASLATQKKSRCRWCFFSSCPWILFTRLPSFRVWLSDCAHKHCTLMGDQGQSALI